MPLPPLGHDDEALRFQFRQGAPHGRLADFQEARGFIQAQGEVTVVAAHVARAKLEVDLGRRAREGAPGVRAQHAVGQLDVLLAIVPALPVDLAALSHAAHRTWPGRFQIAPSPPWARG